MREHDERRAILFWNEARSWGLMEQFKPEMDSEVRHDMVKAAMYILCRLDGVDPTFAAMRACRRACGCKNTDRLFNETQRRNMESMSTGNRNRIVSIAKRAGIQTEGRFYIGGLGTYSDPGAWCSTIDDAVSTAKRKNLSLTDIAHYKAPEIAPPKPVRMAPDVVNEMVWKYTKDDPSLTEKVRRSPKALRELKEKILHKHSKPKKAISHG